MGILGLFTGKHIGFIIVLAFVAIVYFWDKGYRRGRDETISSRDKAFEERRKWLEDHGYDPDPKYTKKDGS